MAKKSDLEAVFAALRDDLQSKIDSGNYNAWFDELRRLHLAVAVALREFQQRPAHGTTSDAYDVAMGAGRDAQAASQSLQTGDEPALRQLQQLVLRAVRELQLVTASAAVASTARTFTTGLRGSLRVSPQTQRVFQPESEVLAAGLEAFTPREIAAAQRPGAAGTETQPPYIASVAALFPLEAATLFPLGKSIAGTSVGGLTIIVMLIVAFIIVLRYFATQPEGGGPPSAKEIIIAVISFLLWVGALGGYWIVNERAPLDWGIPLDLGEKIYGFAIIMWVAIVPYFVRKPTVPNP